MAVLPQEPQLEEADSSLISLSVSAISATQGRDSEHRTRMVGGGVATNLACSLRDLLLSDVLRDDRHSRGHWSSRSHGTT